MVTGSCVQDPERDSGAGLRQEFRGEPKGRWPSAGDIGRGSDGEGCNGIKELGFVRVHDWVLPKQDTRAETGEEGGEVLSEWRLVLFWPAADDALLLIIETWERVLGFPSLGRWEEDRLASLCARSGRRTGEPEYLVLFGESSSTFCEPSRLLPCSVHSCEQSTVCITQCFRGT